MLQSFHGCRPMRGTSFLCALLLAASAWPLAAQMPTDPLAFVDPLIGTGPEGHTFPGASAPFGMVQLSPDTDATCQIRECYAHAAGRSEEHTSELQSLMRISYAVFCLKKKIRTYT